MPALLLVCPHCEKINRLPSERLGEQPKCGQCSRGLFSGSPLELDSKRFDRHLTRSEIPLVVDFWAPWCGPCRTMAPAFSAVTAQLEPRARFAKVNTEAETALAARFAIRSIPTLIVFKEGREVARQSGAMETRPLAAWIQKQL
jgi:thioredoxin 2